MMVKSLKYITFMMLLFGGTIKGQNYIQTSDYIINPYALNQAMAGYFGYSEVHADYRKQWVSIFNGPETYNFNGFGNIYQDKMWLGGEIYRDQAGPLTRIKTEISYSYILQTGDNQNLFFGVWGSYFQNSISFTNTTGINPNDPLLNRLNNLNGSTFNVGFGIVYNSYNFNIGFAMPNAMANRSIYLTPDKISFSMQRDFLFHISNLFWLSDSWQLQAMGVYRKTVSEPANVDIAATIFLDERFWAGVMYRSGGVAAVSVGGYLGAGLSVNYSYEMGLGGINKYSGASHEISLSFRFGMHGGHYFRKKNGYVGRPPRVRHGKFDNRVPEIID